MPSHSASGTSNSPPAVSCHAVKVSSDTGGCQRRVRTVPNAIDTAPAIPAATPIPSSRAAGDRTSSATPPAPASAATTEGRRSRAPSISDDSSTTTSGCTAPTVAATPPGRR